MARPSARPKILAAAQELIAERGFSALTLDAVAQKVGMTKRGLLYHFATKHDLVTAIHADLAATLEARMQEVLGKDLAEATSRERSVAYVRVTTRADNRADLALLAEADGEPDWTAPWEALNSRWFPDERDPDQAEDVILDLVARVAADGLWLYECAPGAPITPALRTRVINQIEALLH